MAKTYKDFLDSRGKLGKVSGDGPTRAGADALPGRSLGGPYAFSLENKLNPTNLQMFARWYPYTVPENPHDYANPRWYEPTYSGSGSAHSRTMGRMADQAQGERIAAGQQQIAQVAAGSSVPILYPWPVLPTPPPLSGPDGSDYSNRAHAGGGSYSGPGGYGGTTPGSVPQGVMGQRSDPVALFMSYLMNRGGGR